MRWGLSCTWEKWSLVLPQDPNWGMRRRRVREGRSKSRALASIPHSKARTDYLCWRSEVGHMEQAQGLRLCKAVAGSTFYCPLLPVVCLSGFVHGSSREVHCCCCLESWNYSAGRASAGTHSNNYFILEGSRVQRGRK